MKFKLRLSSKMLNVRQLIVLCLSLVLLVSCTNNTKKTYSFYHWKTNFKLTEIENNYINAGQSHKLYLRFFDVHIDTKTNQPLPIATVQIAKESKISVKEIIPVIFIRNEVFLKVEKSEISTLANHISDKIKRIIKANFNSKISVKTIQIDCDWTLKTKTNYFQFLNHLKTNLPDKTITATLRLHQVKYREQTGVPPVNKAVLMVYNVGDISNPKEANSIINNATTAKYLNRLKTYPISYDVALPIFQWGVLYRNNELVGVLKNYTQSELKTNFSESKTPNTYVAKKDCYLNGHFIYKADELRVETVSEKELQALSQLVRDASKTPYETIFYHISSPTVLNFSSNALKDFCY